MNRAEITDRLLAVLEDQAAQRGDRQRAAGALKSVLEVRIKDGTQKLSHSNDPELVIPGLARLRDLQSLLVEVTRLEPELAIDPEWIERFGGRVVGVKPTADFDRFWAGTAHQSRVSDYYERLRGQSKG